MNQIQLWLSANKLTLNVTKTKYMLIGNQYRLSHINRNVSVKVNKLKINTSIDRVVEHKYVGSNTDNNLNGTPI